MVKDVLGFSVRLDAPELSLMPNSVVQGYVDFTLNTSRTVACIRLRFLGEELAQTYDPFPWGESMRNGFSWGENDQKLEQKQQITLFDVTEILLGDDPDDYICRNKQELEAGVHHIPFTLTMPNVNWPPAFKVGIYL
ncbi:hypothetical protein BC937DRAFT_92422 [Endogone sp. FLAS-F59071]|nr:hypothetical protein BC937DRAFT_92422 [Endogone sp. FLAS-F59071]|eukprot:RUS15451.1 hypothetical protein BC937DRAFT_92422 [Endogone sp. FLAS-F59071]